MHRFYLPPSTWNPDALRLGGPEAHHARNVLRLQPGDKAVLFDGRGHEVTAEVTSLDGRDVALRKLHAAISAPLRCQITLAQAIPKGKNMDLIVQKAVEIGAAVIVPIVSDRTVVRLDQDERAQKQTKWQTVAIEAAKQFGQNWLPEVQTPRTVAEFFRDAADASARGQAGSSAGEQQGAEKAAQGLRLIGSLQSDALRLKDVLAQFAGEYGDRPVSVLMMIGPEGDFTPAELNLARAHGCVPITLGPIILRVETAAIYCLSVLSYELL